MGQKTKTLTELNNIPFVTFKGKVVERLVSGLENITEEEIKNLAEEHRTRIGQEIPGLSSEFSIEGIYTLNEISHDPENDSTTLDLGLTTGTMAKALQNVYKDQAPDQNPIVVQGMVIAGNYIVLGTRSKPDFRESEPDEPFDFKLLFSPAGYATFNPQEKNPLEAGFYAELKEELGLTQNDIGSVQMIGYNKDRGFTEGTRVTFLTRTNLDFPGLKEKWKSADHSWEYLDLVGLENNSNAIRSFLESTDFSEYSPHAKGLIESSVRPALTHYANNIAK